MEAMTARALDDAGGHIRLKFEAEAAGGSFLPFADGGFETPSGKVEFYSEALAARASIRCQASCRQQNRAMKSRQARQAQHIRWSFCPARPTTT